MDSRPVCRICLTFSFNLQPISKKLAKNIMRAVPGVKIEDKSYLICAKCLYLASSTLFFINLCKKSEGKFKKFLNLKGHQVSEDDSTRDNNNSSVSESHKKIKEILEKVRNPDDRIYQSNYHSGERRSDNYLDYYYNNRSNDWESKRSTNEALTRFNNNFFELTNNVVIKGRTRLIIKECLMCNLVLSLSEYSAHMKFHNTEDCDTKSEDANLIRNPEEAKTVGNFQCKICGVKGLSIQELLMHMKNEHINYIKNFGKEREEVDEHRQNHCMKKNRCDSCCIQFKTAEDYRLHSLGHVKGHPRCMACFKMFETLSELDDHIADVHGGKKPSACPTCGLKFYNLSAHECWGLGNLTQDQTNYLPFGCTSCDMQFSKYSSLLLHQITHSNQSVKIGAVLKPKENTTQGEYEKELKEQSQFDQNMGNSEQNPNGLQGNTNQIEQTLNEFQEITNYLGDSKIPIDETTNGLEENTNRIEQIKNEFEENTNRMEQTVIGFEEITNPNEKNTYSLKDIVNPIEEKMTNRIENNTDPIEQITNEFEIDTKTNEIYYDPPYPGYSFPYHYYSPPIPGYGPPNPYYGPPYPYYGPQNPGYYFPSPDYCPPNAVYGPPSPDYGPPIPGYGPPMTMPGYTTSTVVFPNYRLR